MARVWRCFYVRQHPGATKGPLSNHRLDFWEVRRFDNSTFGSTNAAAEVLLELFMSGGMHQETTDVLLELFGT